MSDVRYNSLVYYVNGYLTFLQLCGEALATRKIPLNHKEMKQKWLIFSANWQSLFDNAFHLCSVSALLRLMQVF